MLSAAPLNPRAAEFKPGASFEQPTQQQQRSWVSKGWGGLNYVPGIALGEEASSRGQKLNPHAAPYGSTGPQSQLPAQNATIGGKVVDYKVVVSTPWYTKGVEKSGVQLPGEIEAFHEFMSLTPHEINVRESALRSLRSIVKVRFPHSNLKTYGSYAMGTAVASSSIDIMVDNCETLTTALVKGAFSTVGEIKSLMCEESTAFAQVESPAGITMNISLHQKVGSESALAAVRLCRNYFDFYKPTRAVYSVLRQVMSQTGNLEVNTGGLSAYALVVMLISLVHTHPQWASSPGTLLVNFCKFYAKDFSFADYSLCVKRGAVRPKRHPHDQMSIIDPFESEGNLAAGCTKVFQIQLQLQHCHSALLRWEGVSSNDKKGYKGRTPLSGVISHQKLWARAEAIQHEREKARQHSRAWGKQESTSICQLRDLFSEPVTSSPTSSQPSSQSRWPTETSPTHSPKGDPSPANDNLSFASQEVLNLVGGLKLGTQKSSPPASPPQSTMDAATHKQPAPLTCTPGLTDSPVSCAMFDLTATPQREMPKVSSDDSLDFLGDLQDSEQLLRSIDAAISDQW